MQIVVVDAKMGQHFRMAYMHVLVCSVQHDSHRELLMVDAQRTQLYPRIVRVEDRTAERASLAVEGELDRMAELVEEHGGERLIPDYFFEFDEVRPRPHKLPLRDVVGMGEVPEPLPSP